MNDNVHRMHGITALTCTDTLQDAYFIEMNSIEWFKQYS